MTKRATNCDRCGAPFDGRLRKHLSIRQEKASGNFAIDSFSRYYCDECARKAKAALVVFEAGGME